jgi:hypothetical protein
MQSSIPNAAKAMCAQKPLHIITTSFLDGNEVLAGFSDGTAAIFEAEESEKLRPARKQTLQACSAPAHADGPPDPPRP